MSETSQDDDVVTTSVFQHLHQETAHKVLSLKSSKQLEARIARQQRSTGEIQTPSTSMHWKH